MKAAIRYYTRSKKGNTKKIADFVSEKLNIPPIDVSVDLDKEVEVLFLINAMYAADVDAQIKDFLARNADKIGCVVNVNSAASGASTYKAVKRVCDKYGIKLSESEYHTVASWIFINKGRPNQADFERLSVFLSQFEVENNG
ncbi:MAG: flavodoxin family protein [Clostridia bacterium]|nr:flavodoxin family protein [Clostridia bacterium]